jgi:beta-lactamase class A
MTQTNLIYDFEVATGGKLSYFCRNLSSGDEQSYLPDQKVPTASVIKLPMVMHIAMLAEAGKLHWDDALTLRDDIKAAGSGILRDLTAGLVLTLRDLCHLTIVLSDNTATNMLIDHVGIGQINEGIALLGMPNTRLLRKAFAPETAVSLPYGLGVSTPREMAQLLEKISRACDKLTTATLFDKAAKIVFDMLSLQQDRLAIPRFLPTNWMYAGKTGANTGLRNDVGVVTNPDGKKWALAFFCNGMSTEKWEPENAGLLVMGRLALELLKV